MEQEVWTDPYGAQRVSIEPLPADGLLDLIVDENGLSAAARLGPTGVRAVRDALSDWLDGAE